MMRNPDERGTATLWVLGLCVALLFLAGLSLDLWRAVAVRRELSSTADTAATAGANGLDENALRNGHVALDAGRARRLAADAVSAVPRDHLDGLDVAVVNDHVVATARGHVSFSLLGIFAPGRDFTIVAHATATPRERS